VFLSEVENSKYGTRKTSTMGSPTGMNKYMPLILNNNHASGVKSIKLYYEKGRQNRKHKIIA
jgi:hypothetical protein